jgi:cytochrome c-type biogenesis protein CcmH
MTGFILIASAMLACSLGFVLPVLLRREASGGNGAPVPRQRWPLILIAIALPALAVSLYAALGNPKGLASQPEAAQAGTVATVGPEQIESMVVRLVQKLAKQPDDADGWRMLARSYETLRRFDQAADAYRHLLALEPRSPDLLVDYAVVLGMTLNRSLVGEPEVLIGRALAIDPNHIQALALSGSAALERGDVANAVKPWKKILALVPADSDIGKSIAENIAKAQQN